MLQMTCPKCSDFIVSSILADVAEVNCPKCQATVAVKDVYVTSKSFTIHRQDLINRIFRYQALLKEVERELQLAKHSAGISEETKRSLQHFHTTLKELLAGARKTFRMDISGDLPIEVHFENRCSQGRLLNLSTEGASLGLRELAELLGHHDVIKLHLALPGIAEILTVNAKVAWISHNASRDCIIGVSFSNLEETTRSQIWDYIVAASAA